MAENDEVHDALDNETTTSPKTIAFNEKLLGIEYQERQEDLAAKKSYILTASTMAKRLLIFAVIFSISLLATHICNEARLYKILESNSSAISECMRNKNSAKHTQLNTKKPRKEPAAHSKETQAGCNSIFNMGAAYKNVQTSYTPLIYLNIVIYFTSLFILVSIHRVRFSRINTEQKDFKEIFSPISEVIMEIIDHFRKK